jgi:uncharacterized OB-fold protein
MSASREDGAPPRPLPDLDGPHGAFYRACAEAGRLVVQRCDACGLLRHPPRVLCAACASEAASFVPVSGRGRLFTWTVTHQATHPAFAAEVPYAVVVTELEEGPRIVSRVRDLSREALALDLPVQVELEEAAPGVWLPVARPR